MRAFLVYSQGQQRWEHLLTGRCGKVLVNFAKENDKLTVIGGSLDGKVLDKRVEALAKLPSLDDLRAKLVGLLNAPATQVARVTQAPAAKLARVIRARAEQLQ